MTDKKVVIVKGEDWEGLYVNGTLRMEGHELPAQEVLFALGIVAESKYADLKWLGDTGRLPRKIEEVEWEHA